MDAADPGTPTWPPDWLGPTRRRLGRWSRSGAGTAWVVAVSGGSDSVGLLRVLHHLAPGLGLSLSVAHLDHGVRGEAARADAAFVRELAESLGLAFDLGHWRPERSAHFEADARRARYGWLREIAAARGATAVAVGHTRDDQAETILHRAVRGTGLRGLAGMPARRVLSRDPPLLLIRPLLGVSREAIREGLRALGQPFREDASNADPSRTRARIRHDLLPRLRDEYNPRAAEALVRLGQLAAASDRQTRRWLSALEQEVVRSREGGRIELRREALLRLPVFLRAELIRGLWRAAGWPESAMSARRWRRIARLAGSGKPGPLDVGAGVAISASRAEDAVILRHAKVSAPVPANEGPEVTLEVPGSAPWGDGRVVAVVDPHEPRDETIDLDRVVPPLRVRGAAPGDRFAPLGMGGRSTPLNDFFRGRGLTPGARARTPLLCDAEGIVWVVGHRIAERVRLTGETTRRLGLRSDRGPGEA